MLEYTEERFGQIGRSVGLSDEQLNHLGDEEPPEGVYDEAEAAIVLYARVLTRDIAIDQTTYNALTKHFDEQPFVELCIVVGMSNLVNRFHATFLSDVDEETLDAVEAGDRKRGACTLPRPRASTG